MAAATPAAIVEQTSSSTVSGISAVSVSDGVRPCRASRIAG
jgi:hypothetical protein